MSRIEIWAPRWRDRTVLVADWKVEDKNIIDITSKTKDGTRQYPKMFYLTGEDIRQYPIEYINGKPMRAVPLDALIEEGAYEEARNKHY